MATVSKKKKTKKHVPVGNVYITITFNNTLVSITDLDGNVISWSTAGSNGFKGARKSTPYAAQITSQSAVEKAKAHEIEQVNIYIQGAGNGREQSIRGIQSSGLKILSITDITPVAHNGCRAKKRRRV